jgi:hypothetical protein
VIEADGGTPQGREVDSPHSHVLQGARWIRRALDTVRRPYFTGPVKASGTAVRGKIFNMKGSKKFQEAVEKFFGEAR